LRRERDRIEAFWMSRVCALALLGLLFASSACEPAGRSQPTTIGAEPLSGTESAAPRTKKRPKRSSKKPVLRGEAAYYSDALAGRRTASGEPYVPEKLTAAHRTLPLGTVIRVIRVDDGRSVHVRVNDRGPYGKKSRIVDLSRAAAERLGMRKSGIAQVRVEIVSQPHKL
jgi:rare lipoprotein A